MCLERGRERSGFEFSAMLLHFVVFLYLHCMTSLSINDNENNQMEFEFPVPPGLRWWAGGEVMSQIWQLNTSLSEELSLLCTWWRWTLNWHLAVTAYVFSGDDKLAVWLRCVNHRGRIKSLWWESLCRIGHCILSVLLHNEYALWLNLCVSVCADVCGCMWA